jgi:hypothetical protein
MLSLTTFADELEREKARQRTYDAMIRKARAGHAAHARLTAARAMTCTRTKGRGFGRPALGNVAKYLLTNLALFGCCGGTVKARSRNHGNGRNQFYGCSGYYERGRTVWANRADVPMTDADDIVIEPLLDEVLDPGMVREGVDVALEILQHDDSSDRLARLDAELEALDQERARHTASIAGGGELSALPVKRNWLKYYRQRDQERESSHAEGAEARRCRGCRTRPPAAHRAATVRRLCGLSVSA